MKSICHQCVLRVQRAASIDAIRGARRAFSSTSPTQRTLTAFPETTNPELSKVLSDLREKHFIPAALSNSDRNLIYTQKNKQILEDNPRMVSIGDEEVQLKYIDRRNDVPNRGHLLDLAISYICKGDAKDWAALPDLLQNYNAVINRPFPLRKIRKMIWGAVDAGKFGVIMQCLLQAERTGFSLKNDPVREGVLAGIFAVAEKNNWARAETEAALRYAQQLATLMESEQHGFGKKTVKNDPRNRPEVLGLYLDLAATHAMRHLDGQDEGNLVKTFARRLMGRHLEEEGGKVIRRYAPKSANMSQPKLKLTQPERYIKLEEKGSEQHTLQWAIWVWHGLHLARKILGDEMPSLAKAQEVERQFKKIIEERIAMLELRDTKDVSFDRRVLDQWNRCKQD